jgi:pyruvate dehydrogenase E2 component (dihydrolipoyllysine-residue acetyltransferase)
MAYEFKFPDIGEGLTEGEIVEWKVKVGDFVKDHQTILEVETDKAVAEVPSPRAGYILSLKGAPGDIINVGEVIAVIGEKEELKEKPAPKPVSREEKGPEKTKAEEPSAAAEKPAEKPVKEPQKEPEKEPQKKEPPRAAEKPKAEPVEQKRAEPLDVYSERLASVGVVGELEEAPEEEELEEAAQKVAPYQQEKPEKPRVEALPKDRLLARQLGIDIEQVRGTGPKGRVTEDDIRKFAGQGIPEKGAREPEGAPGQDNWGAVTRVPLRGVRRKIAQAMTDSITKAAQVTTTDEADAGLLSLIREKEREEAARQGIKLTVLPFIIKAVVGALKRDPAMNSAMDDEKGEILYKGYYNIGIAVETQDGLIVPNIKDADKKSILQIAKELAELAESARKRTLKIEELKGGTFTITNFGSIGGLYATPILNYPEVGILGVGKMMEKPVAEGGAIKIKKILPLSLTFDHRVIDGAKAQHFMNNVIGHIEDPDLIFVNM